MTFDSTFFNLGVNQGLRVDGIDLSHMFPAGTNFDALGDNPSTMDLLKLHLTRAALAGIHGMMMRYATFPRLPTSIFGRFAHWALRLQPSDEHYRPRACSLDELVSLSSSLDKKQMPHHIGAVVEYFPTPKGLLPPEPTPYKLATGELVVPTPSEVEAFKEAVEKRVKQAHAHIASQVARLTEEVASLVQWAVLTKGVKYLTIYEATGALEESLDALNLAVNAKMDELSDSQMRIVTLRFNAVSDADKRNSDLLVVVVKNVLQHRSVAEMFSDKLGTREGNRQISEALIGTKSLPDLFIAFDGTSAGFPLWALRGAEIFAPRRRERLVQTSPMLVDYIEALRTFTKNHVLAVARESVRKSSSRKSSRRSSRRLSGPIAEVEDEAEVETEPKTEPKTETEAEAEAEAQ